MPDTMFKSAVRNGYNPQQDIYMGIKSFMRSLLGEETRSEVNPAILPPVRSEVGISSALRIGAVYRAVDIILIAASQLSLDATVEGRAPASPDAAPVRFIRGPSPLQDQTGFISETVSALALSGNSYWRIFRDGEGRLISAIPLDPAECVPIRDSKTGIDTVGWRGKTYSSTDIVHLRRLVVSGSSDGLGPIQAARVELSGIKDLSAYSSNWTRGSGVPSGILSSDQKLTAEQAAEAKKLWQENVSHADGVAVLGQGLSYKPVLLKPADIQFLETRQFDITAIARLFGIPPHLLSANTEGSSLTYQNIQDADLAFIRWTVMGYLRPIETALTELLPRGWKARFNLDAFLRPSTADRYATYKTAIEAGFLTVEEVREIEGLTK